MEEFNACFGDLDDPRDDNARHDLLEVLTIAMCTMVCGGEDFADMALFGRVKAPFSQQFLRLRHGIPSRDTLSRVFRLLDPVAFHARFLRYYAALRRDGPGGGGDRRQDAAPFL